MVKVFIAGFPLHFQEIELVQLIAIYGEVVTIKIVRDRQTQKTKGYAFIEMADSESAENAIAALSGTKIGDRELILNKVPEKEAPSPSPISRQFHQKSVNNKPIAKKKRPRKHGHKPVNQALSS
ncbi:RNA-binding protein [Pedobacter polaris]|uniref:RNA-binding protein n=1 Tax=Pedobacter polaris TaxID=2571273 RepID=A0A4U1CLZ7_9SPHI|nr:RNA-binding protein [Pedobacter polaris]TKC08089.1 RNA-binding protein [Pedobacter polaris]